jgi:segregation and condensation protein B
LSRKRGKKQKAAVEAVPDDILAEGSGPHRRADVDAIATVEDVVTTDDIATTEDVVTADDVVMTAASDASQDAPPGAQRLDLSGDPDDLVMPDATSGRGPDDGADAAMLAMAGDAMEAAERADGEADGESDGDSEDEGNGDAGGDGGAVGDADEDDAGIVFPTSAATMDAVQLKHLVEALIFASDRPLTVQRLRQLTRVGDVRRLEQALAEVAEDYRERGLVLAQVSGGYQFRTRTQFSAWVQQLIAGRPVRLSRAQLETLAIIAYRQPITRPEIDDIRGVDSSATLKLLIDRMLIRVLGKREEVGRPMLYGTTKEFLDFFSLADLRELPTLREYSELTAESRKVMSDRLGIAPDGPGAGPDDGSGDDGNGSGGGGSSDGGGGADGDGGGGDGGAGSGGAGEAGGFPGPSGQESEAPATASASDLADAVAPFLSAADRSDAPVGATEPQASEPEANEPEANEPEPAAVPEPESVADQGTGPYDPDGRITDDSDWPGGSGGVAVLSQEDALMPEPAEPPAADPEGLDAGPLGEDLGDPAAGVAALALSGSAEPAVE